MNFWTREVTLKVSQGMECNLPILCQLTHFIRYNDIIHWCSKNNVVGNKFLEFFQDQECSYLGMGAEILRRVDKNKEIQKVIYGKDYL